MFLYWSACAKINLFLINRQNSKNYLSNKKSTRVLGIRSLRRVKPTLFAVLKQNSLFYMKFHHAQTVLCNVIILYCNKLNSRIGHKLLQLKLSPLLTCTIHIIFMTVKHTQHSTHVLEIRDKRKSHELMQTGENKY